jgi:hypothetical protein
VRPRRRAPAVPGHHDLLDGRTGERSLDVDEDRQSRVDQPQTLEQGFGLGRPRLVPFIRLRRPREEIAKPVVLGLHPATHYLHRWAYGAHVAILVACYGLTAGRVSTDTPA